MKDDVMIPTICAEIKNIYRVNTSEQRALRNTLGIDSTSEISLILWKSHGHKHRGH